MSNKLNVKTIGCLAITSIALLVGSEQLFSQQVVPKLEGATKVEPLPKETPKPQSEPLSLNLVGENLTPFQPPGWSDKIVVSNVTNATTDAATIYSDQNVYINWAVQNNGSAATGANFYTKLYVDNVEKGSWYTDKPIPATYYIYRTDVNIGMLTTGTHTIKIVADATGAISESNENDNEYSKSVTITVRRGYLTILSATLSPNPAPMNQTETITTMVKETGGGAVTNSEIRYYLSTDNVFGNTNDIYLGNDLVTLPANGSGTQTHAFIPQNVSGVSPGTYFVIINYLIEEAFVNPVALQITPAVPILPNLVATALSFSPTTVNPGGSINLSGTVANNGNAATGASIKINFFLSTSATQIDYNLFLHSFVMNALAAGQSGNFNQTGTVPANTAAGLYYVWISIDPDKTIAESNENDNQSPTIARLQVQVTPPNLTPYQPSGWSDKIVMSNVINTNTDATTIYSDENVYIDWAVLNNGSAATGARFYTKLYVDNVEKGSWFTDPPLNVNGSYSRLDFNIGTLTTGTHTIKIVTDATGAISESNESDNEYSKSKTSTARQILIEGITASFQGQTIQPIGNDLAKVLNGLTTPVTIQVNARHTNPGDNITKVRFNLDGQIYEDGNAADGWSWPNLNLGALPPTSASRPNQLTIQAFDSHNAGSNPAVRRLNIIARPCWISTHPSNFTFQADRYKFDRGFPKPGYGLDYTIPRSVFLIGGKRIFVGLDFNSLWEHSLLSHRDFQESLIGHLNVEVFGARIVRHDQPGTLSVDDKFDIEQAGVQWQWNSDFQRVYYQGVDFDLWFARMNASIKFFVKLEIDLNMAFNNCLTLGPEASFVPTLTGKGEGSASADAFWGVVNIRAGVNPYLSLWLITPLTDAENWGTGGKVWLDWWASWKVWPFKRRKKHGQLGPYQFGQPRPSSPGIQSEEIITQVEPNLPEILVRPAVASDTLGNVLLIWMKNGAPTSDLTIPQIYATIWDAERGFTSEKPLTSRNTFDSDPAVAMNKSGNAVLVWTRNKSVLSDSSRPIEEILANTEIVSMFYDAASKAWSSALPITNDALADGLADVALSRQGIALCLWTHTKDNNLETRNDWEIKYAIRQGNSWSTPALLTNNNAADHSVKVAMSNDGRGMAVWTHDADADARTANDVNIQYAIWNGTSWLPPANLTNTPFEEHHPEVAFGAVRPGMPCAVWVEREILPDSSKVERLMYARGSLQNLVWTPPEVVFADSALLEDPTIQITTRAGEEIALLSWRGYAGEDGDMFVSLKNLTTNTPWSPPVSVNPDTLVDWMSTAVIDSRNNAMILSVKTDLYNPATDNSKLGNFGDGLNYFTAGMRSNSQLSSTVNTVGGYLGDVTGDNKVTALDALVIETYRLGLLNRAGYLNRLKLGFGDVNFDNATNDLDAKFILQYVVEKTVTLPVGKWIWF